MKITNIFKTSLLAIALLVGVGNVNAETTTFISGSGSSSYTLPADWTVSGTVTDGTYIKFEEGTLTSPLYDPHSDLSFVYTVATFGSGTNHPLTINILNEENETIATYTTGTPTSSTYISTNSPLSLGNVGSKFKIQLYGPSGKGVRLRNFSITGEVAVAAAVAIPTFSVASGTYYEAQNVTISCETADVSIYYTTDGTEPTNASTAYTAPIAISSTTTLKAIACTATDTSYVASATYTFPVEVADIAAFLAANAATNTTVYKIAGAVSVAYQNGSNLYVQDASGALLIYSADLETYTNGQTLTGVCGTYTLYSGLNELVSTQMPAAAAGTAVEPTVMTIDQITAATQNKYIKLESVNFSQNATYTAGTAGTSYNFTDGTNTVAYYNATFMALDGDYLDAKTYDIVAIASVYNANVQLLPISTTEIISATPTIYVSDITNDSIPFGERVINGSYTETFTVEAVNLTGDIVLSMLYDGTEGFSVSPASISPVAGVVEATTVTVTYAPTAVGENEDLLTIASAGVTDIDIEITGTAVLPTLDAAVATEATSVNKTSFIANWNVVENATSYEVSVWAGEVAPELVTNGTFTDGTVGSLPTSWDADGKAGFILDDENKYSGNNSVYCSGTNCRLNQVVTVEVGTTYVFSFWYNNYTKSGNGLKDYSKDGGVNIAGTSPEALESATEWTKYEREFTASDATFTISIRAYVACNIAQVSLKKKIETPMTAVTGSPFTVNTNSLEVTGLSMNTTYGYSVVAKAEGYNNSAASNAINVTTLSEATGICRPTTIEGVSFDGTMIRNAANVTLQVYNSVGQLIATSNEDINLSAMANGVYVIKSDNAILKIVK